MSTLYCFTATCAPSILLHTASKPQLAIDLLPFRPIGSPVCFILAAYNYPGAIRSTWGRMADELDDATWDLLDGPGQRAHDAGLGMLLKMTRCHDLGLAQLFFPDLAVDGDDSDATCHEQDAEIDDAKGDRAGVSKAAPPTAGAVPPKMDVVGVAEHLEMLALVDAER